MQSKLDKRIAENSLRQLVLHEGMIDFSSNDYLGFSSSGKLLSRVQDKIHALQSQDFGSGGSRLLTGNSNAVVELEKRIASYHKVDQSLFFTSGYTANIGLLSCIATRNDTIFYDEKVHASIRDGISLSNAKSIKFKHLSISDLEIKLKHKTGNAFLVVESLYSMDGDFTPVLEYLKFAEENDLQLIIDEAHSVGLFGEKGRGWSSDLSSSKALLARVITYGKSFGSQGAAILCNQFLKDYLINFSRPFIYTTGPSITQVLGVLAGYELLEEFHSVEFANLNRVIHEFNNIIDESKFKLTSDIDSPIKSILIKGNTEVKNCVESLKKLNIDVRPILSPTVPVGEERLRIILHSFNTLEDIQLLVNNLDKQVLE